MYEPRVKLTWDDQNEIESGYKIYRSLSTLSTESLPEPLAVLPVNSNEYIDLDVIDGQTYHYLVSAYSPYDEVFSGEIMSEANIANGPGPKTLIAGDMTAGFFGEVPTTELFSGTELSSMIGLTAGTAQHSTQPWLKFAKDNKIIFVAKRPYRHTVTWENIYDVGAVFGTDDSGIDSVDGGSFNNLNRNQLRIVEKNGSQFKVRLLAGKSVDSSNEWESLMYKVSVNDPDGTPWASYSNVDINVGNNLTGRGTWMMEAYDTSSLNTSARFRGETSITASGQTTITNQWNGLGWRPVLEFIPQT